MRKKFDGNTLHFTIHKKYTNHLLYYFWSWIIRKIYQHIWIMIRECYRWELEAGWHWKSKTPIKDQYFILNRPSKPHFQGRKQRQLNQVLILVYTFPQYFPVQTPKLFFIPRSINCLLFRGLNCYVRWFNSYYVCTLVRSGTIIFKTFRNARGDFLLYVIQVISGVQSIRSNIFSHFLNYSSSAFLLSYLLSLFSNMYACLVWIPHHVIYNFPTKPTFSSTISIPGIHNLTFFSE